ncbi:MAG: GspE/PulE family protein [Acidobacteriota bacterium]
MKSAIGCLHALTVAVAVFGVVAFFLAYRPTSVEDGVQTGIDTMLHGLSQPWLWLGVGIAVVASLVADWLERRPSTPPGVSLDVEPEVATVADIHASSVAIDGDDARTLVDRLLHRAISQRASDLHLQPRADGCHIALRVDGELNRIGTVDSTVQPRLIRRFKVLADLVTYRTNTPQDGRFSIDTRGEPVEVRVSVLPTEFGESVVLRFAGVGIGTRDIEALGMPDTMLERLRALLERPEGLIVLTGPTGSGKTTTLYAALGQIHRERGEVARIATIEDPVEVRLPFLSQTAVKPALGLDFAAGLRAVLRQDPNVLMVGEIRDRETAKIAVQAGLTGHLILTTLHADAAAGVFNRLIDLDVDASLVSSAVLASLSQRLLRRLCPDCRRAEPLDPAVADRLRATGHEVASETYYRAGTCVRCEARGFSGRVAIFELLEVSAALREPIAERAPTSRLNELARRDGLVPLGQQALDLAARGVIDIDDALRLIH